MSTASPSNKGFQLPIGVPQFFFDDALIADSRRLKRRWMTTEVYPDPLVRPDKPWEGKGLCLYGAVLPDPKGHGWRMYYSNWLPGHAFKQDGDKTPLAPSVMLATSEDGLSWTKPELDVHDFHGQRSNIVITSGKHLDGPTLLHEPDDVERPWKFLTFSYENWHPGFGPTWGIYERFSEDGIHWTPQRDKPCAAVGDRLTLMPARWHSKYVVHTRAFPDHTDYRHGRAVFRVESDDFLHWTKPDMVLKPDLRDEQDTEYYGLAAFERHGWMIGLLERWCSARDTVELHLAVSRDGYTWIHPTPRTPFIPNCHDWNRTWVTCATNGPVVMNERMVFYFGGRNISHQWNSFHVHGVIGAATLPVDRFCAIEGIASPAGQLTTVPIHWPGGDLMLNADTWGNYPTYPQFWDGWIKVEVLDEHGKPLPEWSGARAAKYTGNTHSRGTIRSGRVRWANDATLDQFTGQSIRLRFTIHSARLFTIAAERDAMPPDDRPIPGVTLKE